MGFYDPDQFTYGLSDIVARLGHASPSLRWRVRYLDRLIERSGFPAPLPLLVGDTLYDIVRPRSRWQQAAVDRWFADRTPPGGVSAAQAAARRAAEDEMDDAAAGIADQIRRPKLRVVAGAGA